MTSFIIAVSSLMAFNVLFGFAQTSGNPDCSMQYNLVGYTLDSITIHYARLLLHIALNGV